MSDRLRRLAADVMICIVFCTRLPLSNLKTTSPTSAVGELARSSWAFPIAGTLVGGIGALIYGVAVRVGVPAGPAAALALATTLIATGCLHEDGLADTADGFGSSGDRDRKLSIMRDSHIGTYGAAALVISILLRWSALASIAEPVSVAFALLASHAAARGVLPVFMRVVPQARSDGLSVAAGRPPAPSAATAALLGAATILLCLGPIAALIGITLLAATGWLIARLAVRQIGGQTGDVLGAFEQAGEIVVLLLAAITKATP